MSESKEILSDYYNDSYKKLFAEGSCGRVWKFIHTWMERPFSKVKDEDILELGSGSGEHFKFVKCNFRRYEMTDIDISRISGTFSENVNIKIANALSLDYGDNSFDRVIVTCVLLHLDRPEVAIQEIYRVLRPGGVAVIYLPCEPGLIFRIIRKITVEHKTSKMVGSKRAAKIIHFTEHRASYQSVDFFIRDKFDVRSRHFPFIFSSWNLNLFSIYFAKK